MTINDDNPKDAFRTDDAYDEDACEPRTQANDQNIAAPDVDMPPYEDHVDCCGREPQENNRHNIELGRRGEDAAAAFLERRGFDILERNWTCCAGEADIIATEEGVLHFIEVKTRMSDCRGFPSEAVNAEKRARYERIVELFLRSFDGDDCPITFDIISILVTGEQRAFLKFHRNVLANDCC